MVRPRGFLAVGFTGTQRGLTKRQSQALSRWLQHYHPDEFHHGDCIRADEQAQLLCGCLRVIHPPSDSSRRAFCPYDLITPPKPYLKRNRDIVDATAILLVCPGEMTERLRSGTWSTFRYALKLGTKIIFVFYPDGTQRRF